MSLVPIIYTSLLIFSAFLLFVIIISYISYKTKSRDRVPSYVKNYDPLGNRLSVQPQVVNNYKIERQAAHKYVVPVQSDLDSPKLAVIPKTDGYHFRTVQDMNQKSHEAQVYYETNVRAINEKRRGSQSSQLAKTLKPTPLLNRLEIMNQSEKFKTSVSEMEKSYSVKKEKGYTNHGDVNLFSYYSDRSDLDTAAFSIPQIQRAV